MDETGQSEAAAGGLLAHVRRLMATLLGTIQNRIELAGLELQEEKVWLIQTLLWVAAAVFFSACAFALVTITLVWLSPPGARPYVLIVLCVGYITLAIAAYRGLRRQLLEKPPVLNDTVAELKKDIQWLRSPK